MKKLFSLFFVLTIIFICPKNLLAVDGEVTYTGINTNLIGDDVAAGPFNIGFTFPFYGTNYTQAYININGTVNFGSSYNRYANVPLNTAISGTNIADNSIYAFWDDLNTNSARNIYYATVGSSPNRKFVTQWTNIYFHGTSIQLGTFQVILYEGSNEVQIQYRDLLGGNRALGDSATVGLRKNNSLSHQYSHNTASLTQEQAIRYTPDGSGSYTVNTNADYELVYLAPEGAPTSPTLINPTDGTTGVTLNPTFEWLSVDSATSYTVLISTVSNFSSTVVNQSGVTGTSYTPGVSLNQNTNYYWRVQSVNSSGSSLSPTRSFTTGSINNAPNTPSSVDSDYLIGAVELSSLVGKTLTATLTDPDEGEQIRYRIQIATDSGFSDLIVDYRSPFMNEGDVTYTYGESGGSYLIGNSTTTLPVDSYYLRIRSEDDSAASSAWYTVSGVAFSVVEAADETPPVISSVSVIDISTSTAKIVWTTDESSTSRVDYGLDNSYGNNEISLVYATSHSIDLSNLSPSTTYYYKVESVDSSSNVATSSDLNFTTEDLPDITAPGISGISVDPESNSVTVYWTTDELASSIVEYGPSSNYTASTTESNLTPRVNNHQIEITGLESCVTYHYRVISNDSSGNTVQSNDNRFTTKDCVGDAVVTSQIATSVATSTGGTLDLINSGRGISISIPPSFSTTSAHFQIKKIDDTTAMAVTGFPSGKSPVGTYTYELHAVTDELVVIESFEEPITITLSYEESDIEGFDENTLKIYRWHNSSWQQLSGCTVDVVEKTVTCSTDHFSTFGLFGEYLESDDDNNESNSSSSGKKGTSVSARVLNLIKTGNIDKAEQLKLQYPVIFAAEKNPNVINNQKKCYLGNIEKILRSGSEGEDVRNLQIFLNCAGFIVSETGAGSKGNETTIFSNRTFNAVVRFQEYYSADILSPLNLTKGTGIFGELSKNKALQL